jgi:chromate reductase, NAD(P)H dehydrogenase (quinone)
MKQLMALAASHRADSLNRRLIVAALHEWQQVAGNDWQLAQEEYQHWDTPLYNDAIRLMGNMPEEVTALHHRLLKADALLIASPEYNWSYPGNLKNTLDWLSVFRPTAMAGKPVLLCCATPSERGGIIGLTHLKTVLEGLGMLVFPAMFPLGKAHLLLNEQGAFTDENKRQQLAEMITGFTVFTGKLTS